MFRVLLLLIFSATPLRAETVTVFAASSLSNAMEEIAAAFEEETGHSVRLSIAGSATLARQIEAGAPADVFISADEAWIDYLAAAGLIAEETRRVIATNSLVLVGPPEAGPMLPGDLPARLSGERLAMANTAAVPAGRYARAALETLDLWDAVAPHVVETENVRAALLLVSRGEAAFGIVYVSDLLADPSVVALSTFAEETHPPIRYPAAAVADAPQAARDFVLFLEEEAAEQALQSAGFRLP